ncbi:hypothetical protein OTU49_006916 [Cherax quadricarinatus]|uniref:Uncharacterized protein n=1 Tax=Cherax quadricarinatus TaxID=27406 RepID=A0AAW0WYR8_CHEQU|nr:uncharacterized protein LOC128700759 [Cherax quadricarinatus]
MQLSVTLLGCLAACVSAFPVMFLAYSDGRALTRRASLLDCNPPLPGLPPSYRCRPVNEQSRQRSVLPSPERLPILEILEDNLDGETVVEIAEQIEPWMAPIRQAEQAAEQVEPRIALLKKAQQALALDHAEREPSYIITVPKVKKLRKHKCRSGQVYIAEVDLCVDMDGHEVLHSDSLVSDDSKTQPHYPQYPTRLTPVEVGYEKRKKCPEGQIYVPEVDICSDIDPVILPPKFSHKKEAGSKKEKN